jgi:hypothetical protein
MINKKVVGYYTCLNKIQYKTLRSAWKASFYYFTTRGNYHTPYSCRYCKKFHLTSKIFLPTSEEFIKNLANWFKIPLKEFKQILK